jgi:hypothetical protein
VAATRRLHDPGDRIEPACWSGAAGPACEAMPTNLDTALYFEGRAKRGRGRYHTRIRPVERLRRAFARSPDVLGACDGLERPC